MRPRIIGDVRFVFRNKTAKGSPKINITVEVELENQDFKLGEMLEAKFVNRQEFLTLDWAGTEGEVMECVDRIWPASK